MAMMAMIVTRKILNISIIRGRNKKLEILILQHFIKVFLVRHFLTIIFHVTPKRIFSRVLQNIFFHSFEYF